MSTFACLDGNPEQGEGVNRRNVCFLPGSRCWVAGEYSADCHESGALSFAVDLGALRLLP